MVGIGSKLHYGRIGPINFGRFWRERLQTISWRALRGKALVLFAILGGVGSLGCQKASDLSDAGSNVKDMSNTLGGMDKSTKEMNETMDGMDKNMGHMSGTMDEMNRNMDGMSESLTHTDQAVHDQTLMVALQNLNDSKNWDEVYPIPFKLMPYGQKFAETASADELMKYFYLSLQQLNLAKLELAVDPQTGLRKPYLLGSPEFVNVVREKKTRLLILAIIAGFAPQPIVEKIWQSQMVQRGPYYRQSLAFMALRTKFISEVFLKNSIFREGVVNIGIMEHAIEYTKQLQFACKLDSATAIEAVVKPSLWVVGTEGAEAHSLDLNMNVVLNASSAVEGWQRLALAFSSELRSNESVIGSSEIPSDEDSRIKAARVVVDENLSTWLPSSNP